MVLVFALLRFSFSFRSVCMKGAEYFKLSFPSPSRISSEIFHCVRFGRLEVNKILWIKFMAAFDVIQLPFTSPMTNSRNRQWWENAKSKSNRRQDVLYRVYWLFIAFLCSPLCEFYSFFIVIFCFYCNLMRHKLHTKNPSINKCLSRWSAVKTEASLFWLSFYDPSKHQLYDDGIHKKDIKPNSCMARSRSSWLKRFLYASFYDWKIKFYIFDIADYFYVLLWLRYSPAYGLNLSS